MMTVVNEVSTKKFEICHFSRAHQTVDSSVCTPTTGTKAKIRVEI